MPPLPPPLLSRLPRHFVCSMCCFSKGVLTTRRVAARVVAYGPNNECGEWGNPLDLMGGEGIVGREPGG